MRTVEPRLVRMLLNALAVLALVLVTWASAIPARAQTASISGVVFADLNTNGAREGFEPGLADISVRLSRQGSSQVLTATTNGNGAYSFTSLTAGTYSVEVTLPTGFIATTDNPQANVVLSGAQSFTVNFGALRKQTTTAPGTGYLWGYLLRDDNRNGRPDPSETTGLAGYTLELYDSSGNKIKTTTTDANGFYDFGLVAAGNYTIKATGPNGDTFTFNVTSLPAGELTTLAIPYTPEGVNYRLLVPAIVK